VSTAPDPLDPNFQIALPAFEGPLDLLLHLIKSHELDVLDLPIAFVTERYLAYITLMEKLDLDIASEYLVMAATLAHIKSKMLLPEEPKDQEDEQTVEEVDPRAELIRRLLEYQKYKLAAEQLGARGIAGRDVFPRGSDAPEASGPAPLAEIGLFSLLDAFNKVLARAKADLAFQVIAEGVSIQDRMRQLVDRLRERRELSFEQLFEGQATVYEMVVTFLALLEMAKRRLVRMYQADPASPIHLRSTVIDDSAGDDAGDAKTADEWPHETAAREQKAIEDANVEREAAARRQEALDEASQRDGERAEAPIGEEHIAQVEHAEERIAEEHIDEEHIAQVEHAEAPIDEERIDEEHVAQVEHAEAPIDEEHVAQVEHAEAPIDGEHVAQVEHAEERIAEERIAEERIAQVEHAEAPIAEERIAQVEHAEERIAQVERAEERIAEVERAEERIAEERIAQVERAEEPLAEERIEARIAEESPARVEDAAHEVEARQQRALEAATFEREDERDVGIERTEARIDEDSPEREEEAGPLDRRAALESRSFDPDAGTFDDDAVFDREAALESRISFDEPGPDDDDVFEREGERFANLDTGEIPIAPEQEDDDATD
jgi:segregation and condensation protein A